MHVVWYSHILGTHAVQFTASKQVEQGDMHGWHSLLASGYLPATQEAAHVLATGSCRMSVLGAGMQDSQVVAVVLHLRQGEVQNMPTTIPEVFTDTLNPL